MVKKNAMKTLNPNTKRAKAFIKAYWNSNKWSLYDCYKTFSHDKAIAEDWCRGQMYTENGYDFKIISHNTFGFSCGWLKTTNKGADLYITTPQNRYHIPNIILNV